jgi:hypothetical protein
MRRSIGKLLDCVNAWSAWRIRLSLNAGKIGVRRAEPSVRGQFLDAGQSRAEIKLPRLTRLSQVG